MKKIIYTVKMLFVGVLLLAFSQACTDLEEELFSEVTPEEFFKTDAEFASALGSAYSQLSSYGGNGTCVLSSGSAF